MGESVEGGEEGVGLNLGLSIGGCFMGSPGEKDGVLQPAAAGEAGLLQQQRPSFRGMYCRNKEEAEEFLEQRRKKEMHALRRQAARRKRDEKRGLLTKAKKARSGEEGEDEQAGAADGKGKEEGEEDERWQGQQGVYPGGGFPVVPMMQYVIQNGDKVQYIPVTVPYVLPCWPASSPPPIPGVGAVANGFCGADPVAIAARSGSGTLFQPVPCRSLPSEGGAPGGLNKLCGVQSSSASSSSGVSDNKSGGGSTTDSRSQSQSSQHPLSEYCRPGSVSPVHRPEAIDKAEGNATVQSKPPVVPAATNAEPSKLAPAAKVAANKESVVANGGETGRAQAEKPGTPAIPPSSAEGGAAGAGEKVHKPPLSLPQMPCVSTTGSGPNGKTITGFLYRYTKNEVSIMCVCHGSSFSPAEFIKHAGGTDTDNPLRHITVVPSPVG